MLRNCISSRFWARISHDPLNIKKDDPIYNLHTLHVESGS
jgi:hypothetical protein